MRLFIGLLTLASATLLALGISTPSMAGGAPVYDDNPNVPNCVMGKKIANCENYAWYIPNYDAGSTGPGRICHSLLSGPGHACLIGQTAGGKNIYLVEGAGKFSGIKLIGEPRGGWRD